MNLHTVILTWFQTIIAVVFKMRLKTHTLYIPVWWSGYFISRKILDFERDKIMHFGRMKLK